MGNICTYGKFNLIVLMKYILHLVKEIIFIPLHVVLERPQQYPSASEKRWKSLMQK